jgi:hypothetical protein
MKATRKLFALTLGLMTGISPTGVYGAAEAKGPVSRSAVKTTPPNIHLSSVDRQKVEGDKAAKKTLVDDAVAAIAETQNAAEALSKGNTTTALAALERATGKLDLLLARNPSTALLPVRVDTLVIEGAPSDMAAIRELSVRANRALTAKDYPLARVLLAGLQEEIRIRTYNLPLATYPQAIKDAVRLIDEKKTEAAAKVLATALNTLVIVDRVVPESLIRAQAAVNAAELEKRKNKTESARLLEGAIENFNRAEALGYAGTGDPEFAALKKSIDDVDRQVRGSQSSVSFDALKRQVEAYFQRVTNIGRSSSSR